MSGISHPHRDVANWTQASTDTLRTVEDGLGMQGGFEIGLANDGEKAFIYLVLREVSGLTRLINQYKSNFAVQVGSPDMIRAGPSRPSGQPP